MIEDLPKPALRRDEVSKRSEDRRISKQIEPPPYQTASGTVLDDRRSHLERRASWLREFSLAFDQPE